MALCAEKVVSPQTIFMSENFPERYSFERAAKMHVVRR